MLNSNNTEALRNIEKQLAEALTSSDAELECLHDKSVHGDLSSRELLQLAWDRAEQEIDELRTELRVIQQRHREVERNLVSRINQRKRLQQKILESAAGPIQVA